ncbi:MAG: NADH-quinone oxidoreductase subunit J, partial [bacterium]|nr:NADH-quinone oxidoreductase subunit J [bacterium]
MEMIFFTIFGLITLVGALFVVSFSNTLSSALSLIVSLFGLACLFALLQAHFVAAMQILLYAGAIMVLFLFVIMLLRRGRLERKQKLSFMGLIGILLTAYLAVLLTLRMVGLSKEGAAPVVEGYGTLPEVGRHLFSSYLVP